MIARDIFGHLPKAINSHITVTGVRHHSKASEAYVDAIFTLTTSTVLEISVPVNYRRTGLDAATIDDCLKIVESAYNSFAPEKLTIWNSEANEFWSSGNKEVTKPFFDRLRGNIGKWVCQGCKLPQNPNWARRTQEIKEMGFTIATAPKRVCPDCHSAKTHLMLIPLPRGAQSSYETWSPKLRRKIIKALNMHDAFENATRSEASLLPDHKFPEIRWDTQTKEINSDEMSERDIRSKFQLLTNQRNLQKREVCRACFQSGLRGKPFGINYFYKGQESWPHNIPKTGKLAEKGCIGCGWYDLDTWRSSLNARLQGSSRPEV
jgi:hypothetical protein